MVVSELNQYYGGSHILRDLSFEVPPGKVTALLGRNGVGKSTLLKVLMGLVPAATGAVTFGGTDFTPPKPDASAPLCARGGVSCLSVVPRAPGDAAPARRASCGRAAAAAGDRARARNGAGAA